MKCVVAIWHDDDGSDEIEYIGNANNEYEARGLILANVEQEIKIEELDYSVFSKDITKYDYPVWIFEFGNEYWAEYYMFDTYKGVIKNERV